MPQDKAFAVVEKEYLAEREAIDRQLDATFGQTQKADAGAPETAKESLESNPFPDALRIPSNLPSLVFPKLNANARHCPRST